LGAFIEYAGLLALISLTGVIASYPVAYFSRSFSDPLLLRADEALRFDWPLWYRVVASHGLLQVAGRAFYDSVFVTPLVLAACFAWTQDRARAHLMIAAYWLSVVVTLALFALMPAKGPLALSSHGTLPYMPTSGLYQVSIIEGLKQHRIHEVDLAALHGLVGAPSFHTTAAILFIIAGWPNRLLRWPCLVVNGAMLLSVPVEGTHYLSDIIAGILVALAAELTMATLLRRPSDEPLGTSQPALATA
jgi:membrane-associated phospholipid phosphatase